MGFIKRKYNLAEDIQAIQARIRLIESRKDFLGLEAWKSIEVEFTNTISLFTQEVFDLCKDPKKNHDEIRCKKMVANALGCILTTIKGDMGQEGELRKDLKDKEVLLREQTNRTLI